MKEMSIHSDGAMAWEYVKVSLFLDEIVMFIARKNSFLK